MNTTPMDHKIEFMAWNENENKIFAHYEIDDMDKDGLYFWSDILKCSNGWFPMQLTALRSINDEPIYNHMIVKDEDGEHFIIDMWDYYGMHYLRSRQLEIVGNCFQSPELLELCK